MVFQQSRDPNGGTVVGGRQACNSGTKLQSDTLWWQHVQVGTSLSLVVGWSTGQHEKPPHIKAKVQQRPWKSIKCNLI